MDRIEWEDKVTDKLAELLDCSRGDAQGVLEADIDKANALYRAKWAPEAAAAHIVNG